MKKAQFENFIYKAGIGIGISAMLAGAAFSGFPAFAQSAISQQLDLGARGSDVTALQTFLAEYPSYYPSGLVTGYYGPLTAAAVSRFQAAEGLAQVGRVGPQTLAAINSIINGGAMSAGADMSAPTVSAVQIRPLGSSATFFWNTGENARAKVFYSAAPITSLETAANFTEPYISGSVVQSTSFSSFQSLTLTGLTPNTTYYYMTESIDAAGNVTVWPYPAATFTTTS